MRINRSGAKTGIYEEEHEVNTMAADALVACIARASATMILILNDRQLFQDKQALVFHGDGFWLSVPSQFWEMVEMANIFWFPK